MQVLRPSMCLGISQKSRQWLSEERLPPSIRYTSTICRRLVHLSKCCGTRLEAADHYILSFFQTNVHPSVEQFFLQVFICIGILVAYLAGLPYRDNTAEHVYIGGSDVAWWRVMLAFGLIPAALQVIRLLFVCLVAFLDKWY